MKNQRLNRGINHATTTYFSELKTIKNMLHYRSEIDGLRAIAVLAVILFHAGVTTFSGGFVGVDIFFVISGYLITSIIWVEIQRGTFSIIQFYERRIRRIIPALFFMLLLCCIASLFLLMPPQRSGFSKSLISVLLFVSNIWFSLTTGYFAENAELKPLLHTWTLSVEEQYYVFFPLFLMLAWRLGVKNIGLLMGVLFFISLNLMRGENYFYAFLPRFWELMLGSIAAVYLREARPFSQKTHNLLAFVGLIFIGVSIFFFSEKNSFPTFFTLMPTLGTLLIILFCKPNAPVTQILSIKPLVFVGLISYSAYLWHQPIFAFVKIYTLETAQDWVYSLLILPILLIAYLSWRFIEQPFRNRNIFSRKQIFYFFIFGTIGLLTFAGIQYQKNAHNQFTAQTRANIGLAKACAFGKSAFTFKPLKECFTAKSPTLAVWGDSYAMHLIPGLVASKPTLKMVQMTKSACGPVLNISQIITKRGYPANWADSCISFNQSAFEYIKQQKSIETVLISSPFHQFVAVEINDIPRKSKVNGKLYNTTEALSLLHFKNTIQQLRAIGKKVVIVAPPPEALFNTAVCGYRKSTNAMTTPLIKDCNIDHQEYLTRKAAVLTFLKKLEQQAEVNVVYLDDFLCKQNKCMTTLKNTYLYRDDGHLSTNGSKVLGKEMALTDLVLSAAK